MSDPIIRNVQAMRHVLPAVDWQRHVVNDGIYCPCAPQIFLIEDDEEAPVEVRHVRFEMRRRDRDFLDT